MKWHWKSSSRTTHNWMSFIWQRELKLPVLNRANHQSHKRGVCETDKYQSIWSLTTADFMAGLEEWEKQRSKTAMFNAMMNYVHWVKAILFFVQKCWPGTSSTTQTAAQQALNSSSTGINKSDSGPDISQTSMTCRPIAMNKLTKTHSGFIASQTISVLDRVSPGHTRTFPVVQ